MPTSYVKYDFYCKTKMHLAFFMYIDYSRRLRCDPVVGPSHLNSRGRLTPQCSWTIGRPRPLICDPL